MGVCNAEWEYATCVVPHQACRRLLHPGQELLLVPQPHVGHSFLHEVVFMAMPGEVVVMAMSGGSEIMRARCHFNAEFDHLISPLKSISHPIFMPY